MAELPFQSLTTASDLAEAVSQSDEQPVVLFKHSNACPISAQADREMEQLATEGPLPVYKLVVQESRPISDEIADALDIRHETPQVILLSEGTPVFDASHYDVTADAVRDAAESASVS